MEDKLHSEPTQAHPALAPKLEITKGEDSGKTFTLKTKTKIGRELDNDIVLIDPRISRHHAEVTLENGRWIVTDLGSSNKTYINEVAITSPTSLRDEDRIGLGEVELTFRTVDPHEKETLPAGGLSSKTVSTRPAAASPPPVSAPAGGPSRLVWLAGAFVLLLCGAAAVTIFFVSRFSGDETDLTADAPETGTSETPAALSSGSDESEPSRADLSLVYEDDFSDSFGGWDDAFDAFTTKQYGNNRYQIEVSTSNLIAWGLANRDVADFELEVEARREDGAEENSYGLLFRVQDRDNFYRFDISSDGYYLLSKFIDGQWTTLVDWTPAPQVGPETNLLKVSAFGPEITVSVNGQKLTTITDESIEHGNFGFFASTFTEPHIWVSFDNLKLWVPEGQEITLIPTPTRPVIVAETVATPTPAVTADSSAAESEALVQLESTEVITTEAEPEAQQAEDTGLAATETLTATVEPTATPVPLPEYASRDQPLGRGEEAVTGQIIFPVFDPEQNSYDIYIADAADGGNRELVQENASQPALNEPGTQIAYRSWQADNRGLFARPLSGGDAWRFDPFFESARPQFSPADDSLMYHSRVGGKEPALYRIVDGVGQVMRREGAPIQGSAPKWGPNGDMFVYNSCLGGKCGVILGNIDGSFQLLTDDPSDINPEISPDGESIVFMSQRSGDWEIYRMDIDGQNLTALTSDDASDGLPTWSPDGRKIAFVSNQDNEWAIWDMDPDGTNQRRLFELNGTIDGIVQHDPANSRGWTEENIDWIP